MRIAGAIGGIFVAAALFAPLSADTIELDFQGVITQSDFTSVNVGDEFTGEVFYSTDATPTNTTCGSSSCVSFYNVTTASQATVDGSTVYSTGGSPPPYISVTDNTGSGLDSIDWESELLRQSIVIGPLASELLDFELLNVGFTGPSSILTTTQIPESFPGLENWFDAIVGFSTYNSTGSVDNSFSGNIVDLSESVVTPEPSLVPLMLLGFAVTALVQRRRQ